MVANNMTPTQMYLLVKVQARARGLLTRKKLRSSPKFIGFFNRYPNPGASEYVNM